MPSCRTAAAFLQQHHALSSLAASRISRESRTQRGSALKIAIVGPLTSPALGGVFGAASLALGPVNGHARR